MFFVSFARDGILYHLPEGILVSVQSIVYHLLEGIFSFWWKNIVLFEGGTNCTIYQQQSVSFLRQFFEF